MRIHSRSNRRGEKALRRLRRLFVEALADRRMLSAAPVLVHNVPLQAVGPTPYVLTSNDLLVTDADNTAAQITFTLTVAPTHGSVKLNGTMLRAGGKFTQQNINDGKVTYVSQSGSSSDGFSF